MFLGVQAESVSICTEIDDLLLSKLSDALNEEQRRAFVKNLLQEMKRDGVVEPVEKNRWTKWRLPEIPGER